MFPCYTLFCLYALWYIIHCLSVLFYDYSEIFYFLERTLITFHTKSNMKAKPHLEVLYNLKLHVRMRNTKSCGLATVQQCHCLPHHVSSIFPESAHDVIFCLSNHNSHAPSFCPPAVIGQWLQISSSLKGQSLPGVCWQSALVHN